MRFRRVVEGLTAVVLLGLAGCHEGPGGSGRLAASHLPGGGSVADTAVESGTPPPPIAEERPTAETPATVEAPALEPITLSGRGDRATETFVLEPGLALWKASHDGRSNFQIHLLDDAGDEADIPLNQIGPYDGTQASHVRRRGTYRLQVNADGAWSVTIEQPRPAEAPEAPRSFNGDGREVSSFFSLKPGSRVIASKHSGDGVFRVALLDSTGRLVEQVAGEIGRYDGSKAVKVEEPGIYLFNVAADGEWAISVD